jgi:hypothetical protein
MPCYLNQAIRHKCSQEKDRKSGCRKAVAISCELYTHLPPVMLLSRLPLARVLTHTFPPLSEQRSEDQIGARTIVFPRQDDNEPVALRKFGPRATLHKAPPVRCGYDCLFRKNRET